MVPTAVAMAAVTAPRVQRWDAVSPVRATSTPSASAPSGTSHIQNGGGPSSEPPPSACVRPLPWYGSPRAARIIWSAAASTPPAKSFARNRGFAWSSTMLAARMSGSAPSRP